MSMLRQFWSLARKNKKVQSYYSLRNACYFSESESDNFFQSLIQQKKPEKQKVLDDGK